MEHVDLRQASLEKIHQVAEKDANVVWSLMHLPDLSHIKFRVSHIRMLKKKQLLFAFTLDCTTCEGMMPLHTRIGHSTPSINCSEMNIVKRAAPRDLLIAWRVKF